MVRSGVEEEAGRNHSRWGGMKRQGEDCHVGHRSPSSHIAQKTFAIQDDKFILVKTLMPIALPIDNFSLASYNPY